MSVTNTGMGGGQGAVGGQADSMLEIYLRVIDGRSNDELLDEINLGTGNYTSGEFWLQVDSFRMAIYASAVMVRPIMARATHEAKRALVDAIYERPDARELADVWYPDPAANTTREEYFQENADDVWSNLGDDPEERIKQQAQLIESLTGLESDWTPPHWRMIKMRHNASQSKDAQALDNVFGRVREVLGDQVDMEDAV